MDSLITAAALALATGDPLSALKRIALRDDAPAMALRGIAMAQLGDLTRAKDLLKQAAQAFGPRDQVARARCVVAEAEIALVSRDLTWPVQSLDAARVVLERRGDRINAAQAACLVARRLLLIGRIDDAERVLSRVEPAPLSPASRAGYELAMAGVAIRRLRTRAARDALGRAAYAAQATGSSALLAEVESVALLMAQPAARAITRGSGRTLLLEDVEMLLASDALVIDACRNAVRTATEVVSLASRPVLFALARALAEGWPGDVTRDELVRRAFRAKHADESHRARLRVEIGRLRAELGALAEINATERGFVLSPKHASDVVVLAPVVEERHAGLLALLADGEAWSSSALAIALGVSPRSVQRALEQLSGAGKVQSFGRGRACRWMTPPIPGFPTTLLLPAPLPGG
ncbi:MAG: helix-turn-helix domain-containing protein [Rhizobiales bacterium]|nr:helix-turn-helix domain-containing protein [Hyphomicrobiales bacterium]